MQDDWTTCKDRGRLRLPMTSEAIGGSPSPLLSRRSLLAAVTLGSIGWLSRRSALAQLAITPKANGNVLVVIFLRGGADGLNLVVPYAEDAYHRARPSIGLAGPNDRTVTVKDRVLDLDGFFGLNPNLAPLLPLFERRQLALVHAVGSADQTRSHFEAMNAMERGLARVETGTAGGWLSRYLSATEPGGSAPLRAVAFAGTMPDSLRGATNAIALNGLGEFRLAAEGEREAKLRATLKELYGNRSDAMAHAGKETLEVLETLNRLDARGYRPRAGTVYPKSDLGEALRQVAFLVKAGVGLEIAALDRGGWDTHVAQGGSTGLLASQLDDLAKALGAFAADMGPDLARVTVVVQTEFGRRLQENSGLGTDHGRAGAMFVLGGGVLGGKVYTRWPGLEAHQLEQPGDLRVTTDYRDVLAEILTKRMRGAEGVFPELRAMPVGLMDH